MMDLFQPQQSGQQQQQQQPWGGLPMGQQPWGSGLTQEAMGFGFSPWQTQAFPYAPQQAQQQPPQMQQQQQQQMPQMQQMQQPQSAPQGFDFMQAGGGGLMGSGDQGGFVPSQFNPQQQQAAQPQPQAGAGDWRRTYVDEAEALRILLEQSG